MYVPVDALLADPRAGTTDKHGRPALTSHIPQPVQVTLLVQNECDLSDNAKRVLQRVPFSYGRLSERKLRRTLAQQA